MSRATLIEHLRAEIVGPALRSLPEARLCQFENNTMSIPRGEAPTFYVMLGDDEEVLYFQRETPHRKYGAGLLHPLSPNRPQTEEASADSDRQGLDSLPAAEQDSNVDDRGDNDTDAGDDEETFDVNGPEKYRPSSIGMSFRARLAEGSRLVFHLPRQRRFAWQEQDAPALKLNGYYVPCEFRQERAGGTIGEGTAWRRIPVFDEDCDIYLDYQRLVSGRAVFLDVPCNRTGFNGRLRIDVFPRSSVLDDGSTGWLITAVLRNIGTEGETVEDTRQRILYQAFFEIRIEGSGQFEPYPESELDDSRLDEDERSLQLLYHQSRTWAIGHGCAAGWDACPGEVPALLYADVMPAVETPSMTPDITDQAGVPVVISMFDLGQLPDTPPQLETAAVWRQLLRMVSLYGQWIADRRELISTAEYSRYSRAARRHLEACEDCVTRMKRGLALLTSSGEARYAFRLANLAMLLQQIAMKKRTRRGLFYDQQNQCIRPDGAYRSPLADIFDVQQDRFVNVYEQDASVGRWRAFQIAFLLMSIEGIMTPTHPDRRTVDLIWFPTGGGKTEAYMAVAAFSMFYHRLTARTPTEGTPGHEGTHILMRYTLRMLTTQQFQRAAALICAMEALRTRANRLRLQPIPGTSFRLGLWIGSAATPNNNVAARSAIAKYRDSDDPNSANPLVLTECPWCRAEIGKFFGRAARTEGRRRIELSNNDKVRGLVEIDGVPRLRCPDAECLFNDNGVNTIPVHVVDEVLYSEPPTWLVGTADKFAMLAYRPEACAFFGRERGDPSKLVNVPPSLIIQDELHLISGPLGTLYGLYEGIIEYLCSHGTTVPKIICSTATIRGAREQVRTLYGRDTLGLFPAPGLDMADSFFGRYARQPDGSLDRGRLYLGLHTPDYSSVLTSQVRIFSSVMQTVQACLAPSERDPWWSLLVFFNSIRELGGGRTLFDSDIRARIWNIAVRDGHLVPGTQVRDRHRGQRLLEELTSRLTQDQIVRMLDKLTVRYAEQDNRAVDACLASSIIEVGVDIDRLSLMGVVGQPKNTAQYIQVTGRIGRRWWERPGLVLMIYNVSKARDRSHYEQFHSYHRRLYEKVEPTGATPFSLAAMERAIVGPLLVTARQVRAPIDRPLLPQYRQALSAATQLLLERCRIVGGDSEAQQRLQILGDAFIANWQNWNPQMWERWQLSPEDLPLMRWPGQYATNLQKRQSVEVPSSMRQVDRTGELRVTAYYTQQPQQ